jgi:hypothetical protein
MLDAMQKRLADKRDQNFAGGAADPPRIDRLDVLSALDMTQKLAEGALRNRSLPNGRGAWRN